MGRPADVREAVLVSMSIYVPSYARVHPELNVESLPEFRLAALVQLVQGLAALTSSTLTLRTPGMQHDSNLVTHVDKARGLRGSHLSRMRLDETLTSSFLQEANMIFSICRSTSRLETIWGAWL